jgi:hypothetical protein
MNILRNKDHFKQSDAELQLMRDELKKQRQHKIENMAKEKSRRGTRGGNSSPRLSMEVSILKVTTNYVYYL